MRAGSANFAAVVSEQACCIATIGGKVLRARKEIILQLLGVVVAMDMLTSQHYSSSYYYGKKAILHGFQETL